MREAGHVRAAITFGDRVKETYVQVEVDHQLVHPGADVTVYVQSRISDHAEHQVVLRERVSLEGANAAASEVMPMMSRLTSHVNLRP